MTCTNPFGRKPIPRGAWVHELRRAGAEHAAAQATAADARVALEIALEGAYKLGATLNQLRRELELSGIQLTKQRIHQMVHQRNG